MTTVNDQHAVALTACCWEKQWRTGQPLPIIWVTWSVPFQMGRARAA